MELKHQLYNDGTYTITAYKTDAKTMWRLQVNNERVGWSDYPVAYGDRIAYDTPEKVPAKIKAHVRSILLNRSRKYATMRDVVRTFGGNDADVSKYC